MLFLVLETNLEKNVKRLKREKDFKKHMIINKDKNLMIRRANSGIIK